MENWCLLLTQVDCHNKHQGGNFTLKCDVLPGVNAKRLWKKGGELVLPSSEAGVDIRDYSSTLIVNRATVNDSGD